MADFNVRSDNVDVEQIMHQIRARIREKRGVDYTEQQIRELATVKLERFLDPDGIRSDLLDQFHRARATSEPLPSFEFEDTTLYKSHRLPILETIRKLLNPILKLFFNPNPLIQALHIQSELNEVYSKDNTLYFELIHNMVVEMTRLSIEVKNLKMRVESLSSRLDFSERRARALEGVVQFKPTQPSPPREAPVRQEGAERPAGEPAPDGQRTRRRRRRRGRRSGGQGLPSGPGEHYASSGPTGPQGGPAAAADASNASSGHDGPDPDFDAPPASDQ